MARKTLCSALPFGMAIIIVDFENLNACHTRFTLPETLTWVPNKQAFLGGTSCSLIREHEVPPKNVVL